MNLSIMNVPEDVVERLRGSAKRHHRSMQGEMLAIPDEAVRPRKLTLEEVRRRVKELGLRTGDDSTRWIREERDAR
jgi:plasmid stability protein